MSILFKIINCIHDYKNKNYTKFANLAKACTYFNTSKKPLLRDLEALKDTGLIEYKYYRHGHLEIELKLERPHSDFTKVPLNIIKEATGAKLTNTTYSLFMFLIYKFQRPFETDVQLSLKLNYLAKVIKSSNRTVKNSLQQLTGHGFISCVFAKFQTHDPCIITPLFLSSKIKAPTTPINTNITKTKISNRLISKVKSTDQTLIDLNRVLKRHNRDTADAPLIIKFLNENRVGLNQRPINSIPAVWEKDLQSKLKLLQFRFSEWKHQQEKRETQQFFQEQKQEQKQDAKNKNPNIKSAILVTEPVHTPMAQVDTSRIQFNIDAITDKDILDHSPNMKNFSNKTNKFSNQMANFAKDLKNFSNNQRELEKENINNHIRDRSPENKQNHLGVGDSDCLNFSNEELKAITQYRKEVTSLRVISLDNFIKRYLDIGVELLRNGKSINIVNLNTKYAEKISKRKSFT